MRFIRLNTPQYSKKTHLILERLLSFILIALIIFSASTLWSLGIPDLKKLANERYGQRTVQLVEKWEQLILTNQNQPTAKKLKATNDFFNQQVRWVSDYEAWNTEDYWATPLETMGREIGDCEDFSIAKYATLLLMGVPASSLRMVYVKLKRSGLTQAHMVLAWYRSPTSTPLILDNVEYIIRSAKHRGDLVPIFSFNGRAIWVGNKTQPSSAEPLARISRWRKVLTKMRNEGFSSVL